MNAYQVYINLNMSAKDLIAQCTYFNCQFIFCLCEAIWCLFQFSIHLRTPPVERPQVHLPFQQDIVFSSLHSVLRRLGINKAMTAWFE